MTVNEYVWQGNKTKLYRMKAGGPICICEIQGVPKGNNLERK